MTVSRKITSLAAAAAIAAGTLLPLSTAADARPRHRGEFVGKHYDGGHAYRYAGPHHYGHVHRKKRRDNTGKAIAIGAGLLMLGIIASQAGRHGHDYDD